ncbi:MAG: hypothetical protein NDI60_09615 [Elusimicrobiales bacterium]|nr:hypothetical protein [Elusimicrobiales bacterium]
MRQLIAMVLLLAASTAAAQVYLGAEVGPDAFLRGEEARIDTSGEDAFAWALTAEISSATLCEVFGSTAPEREALRYLRQGIYRQELAALLLLSEKTAVPFKKLAEDLAAEKSLRALAKKYKADAMTLFADGGRLKAAAEQRMPLFLIAVSTFSSLAPEVAGTTAAPAALTQDDE